MSAGDDFQEGPDVIGCSVRGEKSVDREVPCQDDNAKHTLPGDKYVIAAGDGLGSASLSHVGSHTATQAAVSYVGDRIAGVESLDEKTVQSVLREAFVHAREQLQKEADSRGEPVSKLNTTLLVAVGGPAGAGGAAVGDGGIVCHRGGQTGLLIPREDTEYENKTIPIQSDNWEQSYRFGWVEDVDAAAVFSDGLDGVAWDGPASVSDKLFDQVFGSIRDYSDLDELETFLQDFLDGESIRKSSRDDKTLVVGALPPSEWADPANVDPLPSVGLAGAAAAETTQEAGGPREGVQSQHTEHGSGGVSGASPHQQSQYGARGGRKGGRRQQTVHGAGGESVGQSSVDERLGGTRTRRLAAVAGVVALVVVVAVAGAVLLGPLSIFDVGDDGDTESGTDGGSVDDGSGTGGDTDDSSGGDSSDNSEAGDDSDSGDGSDGDGSDGSDGDGSDGSDGDGSDGSDGDGSDGSDGDGSDGSGGDGNGGSDGSDGGDDSDSGDGGDEDGSDDGDDSDSGDGGNDIIRPTTANTEVR